MYVSANNQMSGVVFFEVLGDIFEQNAATKLILQDLVNYLHHFKLVVISILFLVI